MVVSEDEHVQVLFTPGRSDFLLITFGEMTMIANGSVFWGKSLVEKNAISCLAFVGKTRNWFPGVSMKRLIPRCADILGAYSQRLSFGFSMGAYGALRYAAALGVSDALAFSPQATLSAARLGAHDSWTKWYNPALHADMDIRAEHVGDARSYLFYDELELADTIHTSRIVSGGVDAIRVRLPHAHHQTILPFQGSLTILKLLRLVLAGDVAAVQQMGRDLCRSNPQVRMRRVLDLAAMAARNRHPQRFAALSKLIAEVPAEDLQMQMDAKMAQARINGDIQGEIELLLQKLRDEPKNADIMHQVGRLCLEAGQAYRGIPYVYMGYLYSGANIHQSRLLAVLLQRAGFDWATGGLKLAEAGSA